jgi:hypothetical protein
MDVEKDFKDFEILNSISIELKLKNEWNSENDLSFISKDFLKTLIEEQKYFKDLNTNLKLKLLMSCLSMNKNTLTQIKDEYNQLIQVKKNNFSHRDWFER